MNNKRLEINELINELELDILCITETWLNDNSTDTFVISESCPVHYQFYHVARSNNKGGGIGAYISIRFHVTKNSNDINYESFEKMELLIKNENSIFRLVVIYRSPSFSISNFLKDFEDYLEILYSKDEKLLIVGDFNIPLNKESYYGSKFQNILMKFNMENNVEDPTHIKGNTLDLVITEKEYNMVENVNIYDELNITDHYCVTFDFKVKEYKEYIEKTIWFRNIKQINHEEFCFYLKKYLSDTDYELNVHQLTNLYNTVLKNVLCKLAPLQKIVLRKKCRPREDWFDNEILNLRKERRKYERIWRKKKDEISKNKYLLARNEVVRKIYKKKVNYFQTAFEKCHGDTKRIYKLLRNLGNDADKHDLAAECSNITENEFNTFFIDKIQRIRECLTKSTSELHFEKDVNSSNEFKFTLMNENNIKNIIQKNKPTTSYFDPIPTKLIKIPDIINLLCPIVTIIINKSMQTGIFPDSEKVSVIKPLLKKKQDDKTEPCNYRPISNLTFLSKVIEKAVTIQLSDYLEKNKIISEYQSAYRKNHSTETALLKINNDFLKEINKGKCILLILLDMSAAFDTVDHRLLIEDLSRIGINGICQKWFDSYLKNRKQQVLLKNSLSDEININTGVPQGSILGPILFTIYINEIKNIFINHDIRYHIYADDIQFYIDFYANDIDNICIRINNLVQDIKGWLQKKFLMLNKKKTECILIGSKHDVNHIKMETKCINIDNTQIPLKESIKNIGCYMDENLSMNFQINKTIRDCNFQIKNISKIRKYLTNETTKILYHSLIASRLDFQNSLLINLSKKTMHSLQMLLNKSARIIFNLSRKEHITPHLKKLHWLPIQARIEFKILLLIHKVIYSGSPSYLHDMLTFDERENRMTMRKDAAQHNLTRVNSTTKQEDRIFQVYSGKLYNKLPANIRNIQDIKKFKKELKTFLFKLYYQ